LGGIEEISINDPKPSENEFIVIDI
jgi:hypothetical protein